MYIYIHLHIKIPYIRVSQYHSAQISQDGRNIYVIFKTIWLPVYHHNEFVATHALWHMMYTFLAPKNKRLKSKLNKEHNRSGHKWSSTHRALKSHISKMDVIYMQSWKQCNHESILYVVDDLWPLIFCSLLSVSLST